MKSVVIVLSFLLVNCMGSKSNQSKDAYYEIISKINSQDDNQISISIVDVKTEVELPGANISVNGSSIGSANINGKFSANIDTKIYPDSYVQISFIGYKSFVIDLNDVLNKEIKVFLAPDIY